MLQLLSKPFFSSLRRRRNVIPVSGGSREGARWPPSFLDQTKARRAEKKFWRPGPPLSQRLGDPPPPPRSQGLNPALPVSIADILVLGPSRTQRITGNAFRFSLQPDWQIDDGFFLNGESWRLLKSWYTGGGEDQGFRCCFAEIFFLPLQNLSSATSCLTI